MKLLKTFLLTLLISSSSAFAAPICGILTKESPGAALGISYFLTYSNAQNQLDKIELEAGNKKTQKFLSSAINNSAICAEGEQSEDKENTLIVKKIYNDTIGF